MLLPTIIGVTDLDGDTLDPQREWGLRGSLSAYYYHPSPLGDWFVGSLWAIGVGLMVYMGTRRSSRANFISWVAGSAAIVVSACFPPTTVVRRRPGSRHCTSDAAAVVIIGLGLLCAGFGILTTTNAGDKRRWHRATPLDPVTSLRAAIFCLCPVWGGQTACSTFWPSHGAAVRGDARRLCVRRLLVRQGLGTVRVRQPAAGRLSAGAPGRRAPVWQFRTRDASVPDATSASRRGSGLPP